MSQMQKMWQKLAIMKVDIEEGKNAGLSGEQPTPPVKQLIKYQPDYIL